MIGERVTTHFGECQRANRLLRGRSKCEQASEQARSAKERKREGYIYTSSARLSRNVGDYASRVWCVFSVDGQWFDGGIPLVVENVGKRTREARSSRVHLLRIHLERRRATAIEITEITEIIVVVQHAAATAATAAAVAATTGTAAAAERNLAARRRKGTLPHAICSPPPARARSFAHSLARSR